MAIDPKQQQVRFGQIAQAANPQASDPNQNRNLTGLPIAKKPLKMPAMTAPTLNPIKPGGYVPPAGGPQPTRFSGMVSPVDPDRNSGLEKPAVPLGGTQIVPDNISGSKIGNYVQGGYKPIADDQKWGGQGYSGVDPRTAPGAADPNAPDPNAAPAPAAAGGKGGGQVPENPGGPAGGASAGKGGGATPDATKAAVEGDVPGQGGAAGPGVGAGADPAKGDGIQQGEPGSNMVPGDNTGATDAQYSDTGDYNPNVGGFTPFNPSYNQQAGTTTTVTGHNVDPNARARIQDITNKQLEQWLAAGGRAEDFQRFNPEAGSFANYAKGADRHTARLAARDKFYQDQLNALLNSLKPGVQG